MAAHARRFVEGEVDERREPRSEERAPTRQELLLQLQRQAGNQAVQRMLSPAGRVLQRGREMDFTHRGKSAVAEALTTQEDLDDAVETLIEEDLDGHRALFTRNETATSPAEWRDLVLSLLREQYTLGALGAPEVLMSIHALKDKYREESLQHFAQVHVYWALPADVPPWNAAELKRRMLAKGAYLEPADDEAIEALFETGGKFARTKVEFDASVNIELLDEDNVVVLLDSHQQKHQRDKIPEFPVYSGEPGSKFAPGKGLAWHRENTAAVVKATVQQAVAQRLVTTTTNYSPPKTPKDGIVYDLTITYDEPTGKWVGGYHCNPVRDEV